MAAKQNFEIEKGAKFTRVVNLVDGNGVAISLTDKTMECVIKESTATATVLHSLTEANGGIVVLDDALGQIQLFISSDDTAAVTADFAVYYLMKRDTANPDLDNERTLEGKITYTKGVSV